jgi:hypothetical protein
VYAVGILLYEMLTGRTPFSADSLVAAALFQRSHPAPDVRLLRAEVSPRLAATVARALATDPGDRYPSAVEMSADLDNSWEPPSGASPESLIRTQIVETVPLPMVGVRSGDTEVWTGRAPDEPTAAFAAPVVAAPVVAVAAARPAAVVRAPRPPRPARPAGGHPLRWVALALVFLLAGALAVSALFGGSDGDQPGTTIATVVATPVDEIIPGFARTTDLTVFLAQLDLNPTLVGTAGPVLADSLRTLLDESSSRKQRDQAKSLRKEIEKWAENGQLDPLIADALDALLQPISGGPPNK